jgi:hypothetical protein
VPTFARECGSETRLLRLDMTTLLSQTRVLFCREWRHQNSFSSIPCDVHEAAHLFARWACAMLACCVRECVTTSLTFNGKQA